MKQWIAAACVCLLLTGCAGDSQPPSRMTQQIVTDSLTGGSSAPAGGSDSSSGSSSQSGAGSAASVPTDGPQSADHYTAKAQKDAAQIELEQLESDYRVGKIAEEEFQRAKERLEADEELYDEEADRLKQPVDREKPSGTGDELLDQLHETGRQLEALEAEKDILKEQYRAGEISREQFIERRTELLSKEDALEDWEDALEDALEELGWDDD